MAEISSQLPYVESIGKAIQLGWKKKIFLLPDADCSKFGFDFVFNTYSSVETTIVMQT